MGDIHDLNGDCCPENIPGYESTLHLVKACDIATFPTRPPYDPADPGASVILTTDIELVAMKKFATIPIIIDSGSHMSMAQGNIGSKGFRNELNFEIQGNSAERISWSQQVLNGCYVAIIKDKMGRQRVFGTNTSPARFETIEHGNGPEDSKGTYLLYDTIGKIAPIYDGVIDVDETT
jgi:hypothetical protein